MLEIVDLKAVADLAHAAGAIVVVDNVFATPLLQKPLELGADVVVYSCTKHIDGQGRVLGGAVLGRQKWVDEVLQPFIRNTGPSISPFNAWLLLKGLETLSLRVRAGCDSAEKVANFLAAQPAIATLPAIPVASSKAAMSSAISAMLGVADSFSLCPAPRVSKRSTRRVAESAGSTWSQLSSVPPISCTSTSVVGPLPVTS
jgi:O-succinylhomoserine sulfhydrylase